ncbi:MAG: DNA phosphorothioation-associated DGQHR protein 1 [Sphingobacteriales bacterium JAD_PAG50586_3]|nr:MAG: DNA phosphorothioation-associated DGQHR protein 1 [Sphingobacteriales bacterium JAD_PAG50586_3]
MDNKTENFLVLPALKVHQPLSDFYVVSIPAQKLLKVAFSEPLKYVDNTGRVQGSQRPENERRLKEIAKYIESVEMAFPNSIILAANYTQLGSISKDDAVRWRIVEENGSFKLIIPKEVLLAAVIDGQHRLKAFRYIEDKVKYEDLDLVCSIYFDLPNSYQAFLFATINTNQQKVDRSLALEQFGYNVDDEPEKAWTPEKFAVFLSRKLNVDKEISPFYQHIKVTPLEADKLFEEGRIKTWVISTATIVDGICSLITSNPKRDRILMQKANIFSGRNREMISDVKDASPIRNLFITQQDKTIYDILLNYFEAANKALWSKASAKSYIVKTVGIQALFDILKMILAKNKSIEPQALDFESYLSKVSDIDFSDKFYQASGIGRSRIKNTIGLKIGLIERDKIKRKDIQYYDEIISGKNTNIQSDKWYWED